MADSRQVRRAKARAAAHPPVINEQEDRMAPSRFWRRWAAARMRTLADIPVISSRGLRRDEKQRRRRSAYRRVEQAGVTDGA